MLKRFSTLILALLLGGSALAGTATRHGEYLCEMAGMEMAPATESIPGCKEHEGLFVLSQRRSFEQCCFATPKETAFAETAFNPGARFFSITLSHPAVGHFSLPVLSPYQFSYYQVLPDHQHSYIRNLSLLI